MTEVTETMTDDDRGFSKRDRLFDSTIDMKQTRIGICKAFLIASLHLLPACFQKKPLRCRLSSLSA